MATKKPLYRLEQLIEFTRPELVTDTPDVVRKHKLERENVTGILETLEGYSYRLHDNTFIPEGNVVRSFKVESTAKQVKTVTRKRQATARHTLATATAPEHQPQT